MRALPTPWAQLYAAWAVWLRFVVEIGAATVEEANVVAAEMWKTLKNLAGEQQAQQLAYDPVERFYALLVAALASGKGHIASVQSPDRPPSNSEPANTLGWRRDALDGAWRPRDPAWAGGRLMAYTSNRRPATQPPITLERQAGAANHFAHL